jgi:hypothetical protein
MNPDLPLADRGEDNVRAMKRMRMMRMMRENDDEENTLHYLIVMAAPVLIVRRWQTNSLAVTVLAVAVARVSVTGTSQSQSLR